MLTFIIQMHVICSTLELRKERIYTVIRKKKLSIKKKRINCLNMNYRQ